MLEAMQSQMPRLEILLLLWVSLKDYGSLFQGSRCILAGDHLQLPPTIQSAEAEKKGLGRTLFERLANLYGEEVTSMLTVQYRMHELIMEWSSKELYNSKVIRRCLNTNLLNDTFYQFLIAMSNFFIG